MHGMEKELFSRSLSILRGNVIALESGRSVMSFYGYYRTVILFFGAICSSPGFFGDRLAEEGN